MSDGLIEWPGDIMTIMFREGLHYLKDETQNRNIKKSANNDKK